MFKSFFHKPDSNYRQRLEERAKTEPHVAELLTKTKALEAENKSMRAGKRPAIATECNLKAIVSAAHRPNFLAATRQHPDISPALSVLEAAVRDCETTYRKTEWLRDPDMATKSLTRAIGAAETEDEVYSALRALAEVNSTGRDEARQRAKAICFNSAEPVEAATKTLLAATIKLLTELTNEAIAHEHSFHENFSLPDAPTELSGRMRRMLATVTSYSNEIASPQITHALPAPRPFCLSWWDAN